jgi:hypothetical protein
MKLGQPVDAVAGATTLTVKAGDQIEINADTEDENHNPFQYWQVIIGNLTLQYKTVRTQTITMPQGDVILQAVYTDDSKEQTVMAVPDGYTPTSDELDANGNLKNGYVTLDYSPKDGKFALDPYKLDEARDQLFENSVDREILNAFVNGAPAHREIEYTVKLDYHTPIVSTASLTGAGSNTATPSNASKTAAWELDINLTRAVDGTPTNTVPASAYEGYDGNPDPDLTFYAILENTDLYNANYQLWRVNDDGTFEEIEVDAFDEANEENFTGAFSFTAKIGDKLVLTYDEVFTVTVRDSLMRDYPEIVVKVYDGTNLYDALDAEATLEGKLWYILQDYTDDSGTEYMYLGLAKYGTTHILDKDYLVTENMIVEALYESSSEWNTWHEALEKQSTLRIKS